MNFRNTQYTEFGLIDCEVEHPEFGWIPFSASPNDVEEQGRKLYNDIVAKGDIKAWGKPADKVGEEAIAMVRNKRDTIFKIEVDPIVTNQLRWNELSQEQQNAWANYRLELLDITEDFPNVRYTYQGNGVWEELNISWPTKPE